MYTSINWDTFSILLKKISSIKKFIFSSQMYAISRVKFTKKSLIQDQRDLRRRFQSFLLSFCFCILIRQINKTVWHILYKLDDSSTKILSFFNLARNKSTRKHGCLNDKHIFLLNHLYDIHVQYDILLVTIRTHQGPIIHEELICIF